MSSGETILMLVGGIILVLIIWAVITYNGLVRLRNLVQESWRQIDVELHRRHDLIPNLIETVKGYAAHERAVFDEVTQARAAAASPGAGPAQQAQQENMLTAALGRLFAVAEAYPALRASENFQLMQQEITNTEDRIAAGRRFYNANVRDLNTRVESVPSNIIAGMFSFTRAEYFEVNDPAVRVAPQVSFDSGTPPQGGPQQGGYPGGPGGYQGGPQQGGYPGGPQQGGYPGGPGGYQGGPQQGGYQGGPQQGGYPGGPQQGGSY